jgi:hypothetical protein
MSIRPENTSEELTEFDARMIDDPAEIERLNRTLRRPGEPTWVRRWLPAAVLVAALLLAGVLGFLLRGLL